MNKKQLREKLAEIGYNRDIEIDREAWERALDEEHETSRSLASVEHRNEPTFRDDRGKKSVELKDYRNRIKNRGPKK